MQFSLKRCADRPIGMNINRVSIRRTVAKTWLTTAKAAKRQAPEEQESPTGKLLTKAVSTGVILYEIPAILRTGLHHTTTSILARYCLALVRLANGFYADPGCTLMYVENAAHSISTCFQV